MNRVMKVEIVSKETIKPSSPTPLHLRNFKLSLLDQFSPLTYTPLVLFYHPLVVDVVVGGDIDDDHVVKFTKTSQRLKGSLSETLTSFFPLAGRIKDNVSIDCTDQGVDYFEAHVDGLLDNILEDPETDVLSQFVHLGDTSLLESGVGCLLLVQMNLFKCGGIAIGLSFSHKLFDAATFIAFLKAWSVAALKPGGEAVIPDFTAATLFPPSKDIPMSQPPAVVKNPTISEANNNCIITKRFLFDASNIAALKAKSASEDVPLPTRVEAVSALIWKCAMTAARSNSGGSMRRSVLAHAVNLRKRLVPPLPENSFGNIAGCFVAGHTKEEIGINNLKSLVVQLRKGMADFCSNYAAKLREENENENENENGVSMICESFKELAGYMVKKTDGLEMYIFTSWCRFPLYEADFGWGKPTWVGIAAMSEYKNIVKLMDTSDGEGVHAYVCLSQQDMALFEHDPDLLAFASPNPSVVNMV